MSRSDEYEECAVCGVPCIGNHGACRECLKLEWIGLWVVNQPRRCGVSSLLVRFRRDFPRIPVRGDRLIHEFAKVRRSFNPRDYCVGADGMWISKELPAEYGYGLATGVKV